MIQGFIIISKVQEKKNHDMELLIEQYIHKKNNQSISLSPPVHSHKIQ